MTRTFDLHEKERTMSRHFQLYTLLVIVLCTACKQPAQTKNSISDTTSHSQNTVAYQGPKSVTRNIIQDRKGHIWMASFDGVFRYDGKSFTNMISGVSTSRFFSIFEDRDGNLWFGSIGTGVYRYDDGLFTNFTTEDGLPNNEILSIYQDRKGDMWFGVNGGVSRWNGQTFQNFLIIGDEMVEDKSGKTIPDFTRPPNEINAIVEDQSGKFWFATRGNTYVFDGINFTVFKRDGKAFANVRSMIEDRNGNIWLAGADGLWRYDGKTFTNFTTSFVGYILEDKNGNIWTSTEAPRSTMVDNGNRQNWVLSRYEAKSLTNSQPKVTDITPGVGMLFGIMEDDRGNIWFGAGGVYRYDGNRITDFNTEGEGK